MAIKIYEKFAPRANPADGDYPYGSIKNESVPGAKDGTPLDAVWANDYAGSDAELFAQAGIVPSGQPDKLGASQRVDAINKVHGVYGTVASLAAGAHPVGTYVIVKDRARGVFLVQAGGTADGKGLLDAGNANTAALQYLDFVHTDWVGGDLEYAASYGARVVKLPSTLTLVGNVTIPPNVSLQRDGDQCVIDATALSDNAITQSGSINQSSNATSNHLIGDYQITVANGSLFNVGDLVRVYSTQSNSWSGTWGAANRDYRRQSFFNIVSITGNVLTFDEPFNTDINGATTVVESINTTTAEHKNFKILLSQTNNSRGLRIVYGRENILNRVDTNDGQILGIELSMCVGTLVFKSNSKLASPAINTQYTVAVSDCDRTVIYDCDLSSTRHAVAIVGMYQSRRTYVEKCKLVGSFPADAHGNADDYEYNDCDITGDNGIKIGGRNGRWINNRVNSKNGTIIAAIEVYGGLFEFRKNKIKSLSNLTFGVGWSPVDLGRGTAAISADSRQNMEFIFDGERYELPNLATYFIRLQNNSAYKANVQILNVTANYPAAAAVFRYEGTPSVGSGYIVINNVNINTAGEIPIVQRGSGATGYDTAKVVQASYSTISH